MESFSSCYQQINSNNRFSTVPKDYVFLQKLRSASLSTFERSITEF